MEEVLNAIIAIICVAFGVFLLFVFFSLPDANSLTPDNAIVASISLGMIMMFITGVAASFCGLTEIIHLATGFFLIGAIEDLADLVVEYAPEIFVFLKARVW